MKKVLFICGLLFFCFSFAYAENSKEFTFAWRALGALHFCQWAMDYRIKENHASGKTLMNSFWANEKFKDAKAMMQKYINDNDKDKYIKSVRKKYEFSHLGFPPTLTDKEIDAIFRYISYTEYKKVLPVA